MTEKKAERMFAITESEIEVLCYTSIDTGVYDPGTSKYEEACEKRMETKGKIMARPLSCMERNRAQGQQPLVEVKPHCEFNACRLKEACQDCHDDDEWPPCATYREQAQPQDAAAGKPDYCKHLRWNSQIDGDGDYRCELGNKTSCEWCETLGNPSRCGDYCSVSPGKASDVLADLSYLRYSVLKFAFAIEGVLRKNDHKGGWEDCSLDYLFEKLQEEVGELEETLDVPGFGAYDYESADVGAVAHMIFDKGGVCSTIPDDRYKSLQNLWKQIAALRQVQRQ